MSEISTELIKQAVYDLCFKANTCLDKRVYQKISAAYSKAKKQETRNILKSILQNARTAYEKNRPLCQDTGQVIVFLEIGQEVKLTGEFIEEAVNSAVEKCYRENFFRKSVVENAVFKRVNTTTNTPCIIYTDITRGDEINIQVLIKGAGSENKSRLEMLLPTTNEEEIVSAMGDLILSAGENACPPMFIGIGIGASADKAAVMSKKALVLENFKIDEKNNQTMLMSEKALISKSSAIGETNSETLSVSKKALVLDCLAAAENELAQKIKNYVNQKSPEKYGDSFLLDVKLKTCQTHIACLPAAVTINCHSDRTSSCRIKDNKIFYYHQVPDFIEFDENNENGIEIFTGDIETIRRLKKGDEILLTGEIFTARDMAHKRIVEMMRRGEPLPFDLKNKIIFYAGPCPAKDGEITGSIGPTTASRMDKYAVEFYNAGMIASIGKGSRSEETIQAIKRNNAKYFTVTGGIAALLADRIKESSIIAFEDLGAEAVYRLRTEKLPVKVEI